MHSRRTVVMTRFHLLLVLLCILTRFCAGLDETGYIYDDFVGNPSGHDRWEVMTGAAYAPGGYDSACLACWNPSGVTVSQIDSTSAVVLEISSTPGCATGRDYSSGRFQSALDYSYPGVAEVRMKIPSAEGVVSSFFLEGWDSSRGNYSIRLEFVGKTDSGSSAVIMRGIADGITYSTTASLSFDAAADYHTYTIRWEENRFLLYVDGSYKARLMDDHANLPPMHIGLALWPCLDSSTEGFACLPAFSYSTGIELRADWLWFDSSDWSECCNPADSNVGFTDSFKSSSLDTKRWNVLDGFSPSPPDSAFLSCWSNQIGLYNWVMDMGISPNPSGSSCTSRTYTSPLILTKRKYRFGYFDAGWQPMKENGVVNTFMLQLDAGDSPPLEQFSSLAMTIFGRNTTYLQASVSGDFVTPLTFEIPLGFDSSLEMHRYGMFWNLSEVSFWVDDVLVHRATADTYDMHGMSIALGVWPCGSTASPYDCSPPSYSLDESVRMRVKYVRYDSNGVRGGDVPDYAEDSDSSNPLAAWQIVLIVISVFACLGCLNHIVCIGAAVEIYVQGKKLYKKLSEKDSFNLKAFQKLDSFTQPNKPSGSTSGGALQEMQQSYSPPSVASTVGKEGLSDTYGMKSADAARSELLFSTTSSPFVSGGTEKPKKMGGFFDDLDVGPTGARPTSYDARHGLLGDDGW